MAGLEEEPCEVDLLRAPALPKTLHDQGSDLPLRNEFPQGGAGVGVVVSDDTEDPFWL